MADEQQQGMLVDDGANADARRVIALLTDFGTQDGYVGVMKGVIAGIAPNAHLIDLTHEIPPQDIGEAAWVLATAWQSFPSSTLFLCVVDHGVGTDRRAVAVACRQHLFVAPDNGLLSYVLDAAPASAVVSLDQVRYHLPHASATFHGRDVFAPCAAWLAAGTPLCEIGSSVPTDSLVRLPPLIAAADGEAIRASIVHVDHYGNLITSIGPALTDRVLAAAAPRLTLNDRVLTVTAQTFAAGPSDEPFLLRDSSGYLAVAVRNGSAAAVLGVARGASLTLTGVDSAHVAHA